MGKRPASSSDGAVLAFPPNLGWATWLARGGQTSAGGPEHIQSALEQSMEQSNVGALERQALRLVDTVLPYSLLFDDVTVPGFQDYALSPGFTEDLRNGLGINFLEHTETRSGEIDREWLEERAWHFIHTAPREEVRRLYALAGPLAGDDPDLVPALMQLNLAAHIARSGNKTLIPKPRWDKILQRVCQDQAQATEPTPSIVNRVFRAHGMPELGLDAFRNDKGLVDLDHLFASMARLRCSDHLGAFRSKIHQIQISDRTSEETINEELVADLRHLVESHIVPRWKVPIRFVRAVLKDAIGLFLPVPTDTVGEIRSAMDQRKARARFAWRTFVFEYADEVQGKRDSVAGPKDV